MEIRQLRYFVAVADDRHFRKAAARLHIAQPAVSEQIRKLEVEVEVGVKLLDRTSRSVEVTPAGAAFLENARRILRDIDEVGHAARSETDPACHDATLAAFHGAGLAPNVLESTATTIEQLLLEVLAGGTTILPASAASRIRLPGLSALPLSDAAATVPMGVVTRDEPPGAVLARLLDELAVAPARVAEAA
ncbi:MAG TPA: LysR family transcriptional regulator [Baekduia sp.]|uniref:LysR family transcriptional regulator n=1 Tax=Baekduia sp. TaxID=2600305 RepID=UPI002C219A71|nr:LysR family transcriptional regulator [Baekduia sp.]HMJ34885.1 LysR family transcriptional regulator [Baekduia sp.]